MIKNHELVAELRAMQEIGIKVDDRTLNHANSDDLSQYQGISVRELASLYCELYNWT